MAERESVIRGIVEESLGTRVNHAIPSQLRSGQICGGIGLDTECGKVFVKILKGSHPMGHTLFSGEMESLKLIKETKTIRVPKPLKVTEPGEIMDSVLILEYLEMTSLTPECAATLGEQLARLHLDNHQKLALCQGREGFVHKEGGEGVQCVEQYGFHIPTYNGNILQENSRQPDWKVSDRDVIDLWPVVLRKLQSSSCFGTDIKPSLLHGDFHNSNIAEVKGQPVTFDPSSFYGHHEFDISMAAMFGEVPPMFWESYHQVIPRAEGFESRKILYDLHIYLNHWNHFGPDGYMNWREEALKLMRRIVKEWS